MHAAPEKSPFSVQDELALVRGMMEGSERAWRSFHVRYDRLIFRCITKVTGRFASILTAEDVREVYATLMVQLLANEMHKLRSFDPDKGNRLGSWLGLLAINAAYDYLRSLRREPHRAPVAEAEQICCGAPSPLDVALQRERADRVSAVLEGFSDKDREFMLLYFGEGLEPEQVAARMRISVKTVYSKKHKIRSRLEAVLNAAA